MGVLLGEPEEDVEVGRGMADAMADAGVTTFANFVGRVGDVLTGVVDDLDEVGGGGVALTVRALDFNAALWGRGLIGREAFSEGEMVIFSASRSSFSSSEVLNGRREPVVGDGDLVDCTIADLGRYFGSPEPTVLERRVTVRTLVSKVLGDGSSIET